MKPRPCLRRPEDDCGTGEAATPRDRRVQGGDDPGSGDGDAGGDDAGSGDGDGGNDGGEGAS